MSRVLSLAYGIVAYVAFILVMGYAVGFVGNAFVPKTLDLGATSALQQSLLVNLALLTLFGVQHSVMARPRFKEWLSSLVPTHIERSTYVLVSSAVLAILFWQWRPMPEMIYSTGSDLVATVLIALFWLGWISVLLNSMFVGHLDAFGLRQVMTFYRGDPYTPVPFRKEGGYKLVRHPMMLGFVVAFWATPDLSIGHVLFSGFMTMYILVAIRLEEVDLVSKHGEEYVRYKEDIPMLIPTRIGDVEPFVFDKERNRDES